MNLKNYYGSWFLLLLVILLSEYSNAQPVFSRILDMKYSDLPVNLRVENSGIYFISSFHTENGGIWLNSFDSPVKYFVKNNEVRQTSSAQNKISKHYFYNRIDEFTGENGSFSNESNESIDITVSSRSELQIKMAINKDNKLLKVSFPSDLAYADLIGVDKDGNIFLITESYINEIPLKVKREVYCVSPAGSVLSVIAIPLVKYIYSLNDLQIDADGNLYSLLSDLNGMYIYKISGLTKYNSAKISFPNEPRNEIHYNNFVTTDEYHDNDNSSAVTKDIRPGKVQLVSRVDVLKTGESYVLYKYLCSAKNLAPQDTPGSDGDIVRTPSWLIKGVNAKVPYKWGGFNTLADFSTGLKNGKFAGDINTKGISSQAVGVDCSGFVSRCWNLNYHSTTSEMLNTTYLYNSWDKLRPGDAILKSGHVRMFVDRAKNGAFRTIEASARDWGVSYWTYTPSDLTSYYPVYPQVMVSEYSTKQPVLTKVKKISGNSAELKWSCDTDRIKGYRLYKSTDGIAWSMVKDTNSLKGTSDTVTLIHPVEFFRVASVQDSTSAESNWSNVMGVGVFPSINKVLVVDGFEREAGAWRGNGNTFAMTYGKALQELQINFDMIKNRELSDSVLSSYDIVYWILGDESTSDETFSASEQKLISEYLEKGGKVFVSGSEIGWDLYYKGTAADKVFFNNYLKAMYANDNALSRSVYGTDTTLFGGISFTFGQTYDIGYPDEIFAYGGSKACMSYHNKKTAGVSYSGKFGSSDIPGKMIYLAFPLETTANDTSFNNVIKRSVEFFTSEVSNVNEANTIPESFSLSQNYPNPFNPETKISFSLGHEGFVTLKVYNLLGEEVSTLVNETKRAGSYTLNFNAGHLSSGIYYYILNAPGFSSSRKMLLIK